MTKRKKKKKLKASDIKNNSSREIGGVINNIKRHEKRYTIILVILFMLLFFTIAYFTFRVNETYVLNNEIYTPYKTKFTISSNKITLNEKNIMNDNDGINSKINTITYKNNTSEDKNYRIKFICEKNCSKDNFQYNKIKYSFDGIKTYTLTNINEILKIGIIKSGESVDLHLRMWLSEDIDKNKNINYKAKLIIEEMEDI